MDNNKKRSLGFIFFTLLLMLVFSSVSMPDVVNLAVIGAKNTVSGVKGLSSELGSKEKTYIPKEIETSSEEFDATEIIVEDISKRTETSKTFVQADGTYVMQEYGTPIHYLDGEEYYEIDNTITNLLENKANSFNVKFNRGESLATITDEKGSISMTPVSDSLERGNQELYVYDGLTQWTNEKTYSLSKNDALKEDYSRFAALNKPVYESDYTDAIDKLNIKDDQMLAGLKATLINNKSSLYYSNVYDDIDVQYILEGKSLKENIILHAPQDEYIFKFELDLYNYTAEQIEGDIFIYDRGGNVVYTIPKGYMTDATGQYSDQVEYQLEYYENKYILSVIACENFINNSTFPVIIDPTLTQISTGFALGSYRRWANPGNHERTDWFRTKKSGTLIFGTGYQYSGYANLETTATRNISDNYTILNAEFKFYYPGSSHNFETGLIYERTYQSMARRDYDLTLIRWYANNYLTIDVTSYISNYDAIRKATITIDQNVSSDFSSPILTIIYEEPEFDSSVTQDLGESGVGSVCLYTQKLSYTYNDIVTNDGNTPISISHIYDDSFGSQFSAGTNFKLNIEQQVGMQGSNYYYLDASGKKHFFSTESTPKNKSLGLWLYPSGNIIQLIDRQGNSMVFNNIGGVHRLIEMHQFPSRYGSELSALVIKLTYTGNLVTGITNNKSTFVLQYTNNLLTGIRDSQSTNPFVSFVFNGNRITQANKFFMNTVNYTNYLYNVNFLESIAAPSSKKIKYSYLSTDSSAKVSSISTSSLTSATKTINITTHNSYISASETSGKNTVTKTIVLNTDNSYRHVSFCGNRIVSDYAYRIKDVQMVPVYENSNNFNYFSFEDTYANIQELYCEEFNQPSGGVTRTISVPTTTTFQQYAISAWVLRNSGTISMEVTPFKKEKQIYHFNNSFNTTKDWQFATIIVDGTNRGNNNIILELKAAGGSLAIKEIRIVALPPQLDPVKAKEFIPENEQNNSDGQLVKSLSYNSIDNTILTHEYVYGFRPTGFSIQYPMQLSTIVEYSGSANLTKDQYFKQRTQKSRIEYVYFSSGQLKTTIAFASSNATQSFQEEYTYDSSGRVISYTDENGIQTNYDYVYNKIITIGEDGSPTISTMNSYNKGTSLIESTSTGDVGTYFSYNQNGIIERITNNGTFTYLGHENDGSLGYISIGNNLLNFLVNYNYSQTQDMIYYGNNQAIRYNYNNEELLTNIQNSNSTQTIFSYNNKNELTSIQDASGVSYEFMGNYYGAEYTVTNGGNTVTDGVIHNGNNGPIHIYGYNGYYQDFYQVDYDSFGYANQLKRLNSTIYYSYNQNQQLLTKKSLHNYGGSFFYDYTYKVNSSLVTDLVTSIQFKVGSTTMSKYIYNYYNNGNLQSISQNNQLISEYKYDQNNRLVEEKNYQQGKIWVNTFDNGGNITKRNAYNLQGSLIGTDNYQYSNGYNNNGWKDQLLAFNEQNISYDNAGNPLQYKDATLTWKNGRQLESYQIDMNQAIIFDYDYAGFRTKKNNTYYFWEGDTLLAEKTNNDLIWYYYDESGIAGMRYQNTDYIFEKNILGDILAIYNMQTGQKMGEYTYDAWGNILTQTNNSIMDANPFRYRGYYYDTETNLYYLQSRYYDPEVGRFINADEPIMLYETANSPGGANLYSYCLNNSITYVDPTGEWIQVAIIVALLIVDVVSAAWDAYQYQKNPSNENLAWLASNFLFGIGTLKNIGKGVKAVDKFLDVGKTTKSVNRLTPYQKGLQGERYVKDISGLTKNTTNYGGRIPDFVRGLNDFIEVKNVKNLYLTKQLRDMRNIGKLEVWTRQSTKISPKVASKFKELGIEIVQGLPW